MNNEKINKLKDGYIYFKNGINSLERRKKIVQEEIADIDKTINQLYYELSIIIQSLNNEEFDMIEFLEKTKDI